MARESQRKQAGPCGPAISWSCGNFSNAKFGRSGLYFCKEKQNPNTYDSPLFPKSPASPWCSLRICKRINEPEFTYWTLSCFIPLLCFIACWYNTGNFYSGSSQYPLSIFYEWGTKLVALGDTSMSKIWHLASRNLKSSGGDRHDINVTLRGNLRDGAAWRRWRNPGDGLYRSK